jgi:hypothetical protein
MLGYLLIIKSSLGSVLCSLIHLDNPIIEVDAHKLIPSWVRRPSNYALLHGEGHEPVWAPHDYDVLAFDVVSWAQELSSWRARPPEAEQYHEFNISK